MRNQQTNHYKIDFDEYFQNLHEMVDLDINRYAVAPLRTVGNLEFSSIDSISEISFNSLLIHQPATQKKSPLMPNKLIFSCLPPDILPLKISDITSCWLHFESFQNSPKHKTCYSFFYDTQQKYYLDNIFEHASHLFFRFRYKNQVAIDKSLPDVAVFPHSGQWNYISKCESFQIQIPFFLHPDYHDLFDTNSRITFTITDKPDFLEPQMNSFEIHGHQQIKIPFIFKHNPPFKTKMGQIKLNVPFLKNSNMSIPVKVKYVVPSQSITFHPRLTFNTTIPHGEKITLQCPYTHTRDQDSVKIHIFGNGINDISYLTLQSKNPLSVTFDTNAIHPMHEAPLSMYMINNSPIINKRVQRFTLDMAIVRLFAYPENGLFFNNIPWRSIHSKTLRFIRSDFIKNIIRMHIRIPLPYQRFIQVKKSREMPDQATFIFDFNKVPAKSDKQGYIEINATCADGLALRFKLPFQFSIYSVKPDTPIRCAEWIEGKSTAIHIHLRNNTSIPFEIQNINWKHNNFKRLLKLHECDDQMPIRIVKSFKTIRFQPIQMGSWYKEVEIEDTIQIISNWIDYPVYEKEYSIKLSKDRWFYRMIKPRVHD